MKPHNGFSNYPTWNAALWIDNDPGTYEERLEIVNTADSKREASGNLKEWFEAIFPIPETGPIADIAGWAIAHIDWDEITEHWWAEREEEAIS